MRPESPAPKSVRRCTLAVDLVATGLAALLAGVLWGAAPWPYAAAALLIWGAGVAAALASVR